MGKCRSATAVNAPECFYQWEIEQEGDRAPSPCLDILEYWQPKSRNYELESNAIALYVKSQSRSQSESSSFWIVADKMLGKLELKIQPLPSPLVAPKGIMGVSLQTDNSLIPVLELDALQQLITTEVVTDSGDKTAGEMAPTEIEQAAL